MNISRNWNMFRKLMYKRQRAVNAAFVQPVLIARHRRASHIRF
jgi:hypothetical protein